LKTTLFALLLPVALLAADPTQAEISNGVIRAKLYLPDAQQGYYQGTRFDWSGVMPSLEYKGHQYFGQWFPKYDPKQHDAIMGPVEEFLTSGAGLGYAEAKPGENFVKIGVGAIKKPDEPRFRQFSTYEIADHGKWTVKKAADHVEFAQELKDTNGYAYVYRKTVRLTKGKPELVLQHTLKNTGKKVIESSVYEHNFWVIDSQPTGPDFTVTFPFDAKNVASFRGLAETKGKQLVYLSELQQGQTAQSVIEGYGASPSDYDIRVENKKTGAGVRTTADRPLSKINFWSIRSTLCPEPYIDMKIEPGKEFTWTIKYEFYTLEAAAGAQPADASVKVDNEYVRVKVGEDAPLSKTALHKHDLNRVMIYLTEVDQEIRYQDGRVVRPKRRPGEVAWSPAAGLHVGENFSKHAIRAVEVELKKPPSGKPFALSARDPLRVNAKHCTQEFDNEQVRVLRCKYPANFREPLHEHLNLGRVTVTLNDVELNVKTEGAADRTVALKTGDAAWNGGPVVHSAQANRATELIIVDVK
jgi:hypothetical protein